MINKKTKLKIITQMLVATSIVGLGTGYEFFINPIQSNAIYTSAVSVPVKSNDITQVVETSNHSFFIKNDGTVWGSGYNGNGELGIGNKLQQNSPVKIPINNVKKIMGGTRYTIFIKNDGTIWLCGASGFGQVGLFTTPIQLNLPYSDIKNIYTGNSSIFFIKNDGTVWSCGSNNYGDLGIGNQISQPNPVQIPITDIKDISCSYGTTFFIKNDGTVLASGSNDGCQYGDGTTNSSLSPIQIPINNVKSINCSDNSTIFIKNDGTIWGAGRNVCGELGIGNTVIQKTPVKIPIDNVKNIDSGRGHTIFIKNDGTVWGVGKSYTLGLSNTATYIVNLTQLSITDVDNVSCGQDNTILIKNNGTIWGGGFSEKGELGIGVPPTTSPIMNLTNYWIAPLDSATNAVVKAESSKLQVDVDSARVLVNALTNATDKTNLTNRLTAVQTTIDKAKQDALNLTDATTKVTEAESTKTQIDIDTAQIAINKLSDGTDKTNLQNRLDAIKTNLAFQALTEATNAVVKAEDSKTQVDVASAKILLNALPDGTAKTDLTNRLDVVQIEIDKAKQDALNTQLLAEAKAKVATAESTKTQADVDIAQTAINKLAIGTDKTDLQARLDKLKSDLNNQTQILTEATNAVTKAETTKTQEDVDSAQTLVNALPDGTDKTDLTNKLNVVQAEIDKAKQDALNAQLLADAQFKVATVETTKTQADIDIAQTAINKLATGTDKTALQIRLDIVKDDLNNQTQVNADLLDAQTKVTKAETTKTQADIDIAQIAINKLTTGTDKTALQVRLDKVKADLASQAQALTEATNAVTKAETTKTQGDVDIAKTLVNTLPNGIEKADLINNLKEIQDAINKANQDVLNAQLLADAKTKVTTAESTKSQTDVNIAQTAINKLPSGTDKTDLQARIDVVKKAIADKQAEDTKQAVINNATALVTTAESTKTDVDILRAQTAVNTLPVGTDRTELQNRLNAITQQIAKDEASAIAIKEATEKVRWAEAYVTNSKASDYIVKAQTAIDNLPSGADKTALQEKIGKLKVQIANTANATLISQANILVKQAELMKKNPYITNAWAVVNKMTACDAKTNFINRLNAIK